MNKKLVVYFSATGRTERTAKSVAETLDADLCAIRPRKPYENRDLNFMDSKARSTLEMNNAASRPEIEEITARIKEYDTVIIGFPVWWYTAPRIINTFIESTDLKGKDIFLFATSGGSTVEKAQQDLKKSYPELNIIGAKTLNGIYDPGENSSWIQKR